MPEETPECLIKNFTPEVKNLAKKYVSPDAAKDPQLFLLEVFNGLKAGNKYPDEILHHYYHLMTQLSYLKVNISSNRLSPADRARLQNETTRVQSTPKTEPKVEARPKTESVQETVAQSNNITSFTTNNGQNVAFEGGMSKMFKITHASSDEAIITLSKILQ